MRETFCWKRQKQRVTLGFPDYEGSEIGGQPAITVFAVKKTTSAATVIDKIVR